MGLQVYGLGRSPHPYPTPSVRFSAMVVARAVLGPRPQIHHLSCIFHGQDMYRDPYPSGPIAAAVLRAFGVNVEGCRVSFTYLELVGNGRMVVIVVIIVPHSSIPY